VRFKLGQCFRRKHKFLITDDPAGKEFFELASKQLQNKQYKARGSLTDLLEHQYFSHPVVSILEFLYAITLKTTNEKEVFFRCGE
jgi:hypothetical protein